jgi:hypothetical protein
MPEKRYDIEIISTGIVGPASVGDFDAKGQKFQYH